MRAALTIMAMATLAACGAEPDSTNDAAGAGTMQASNGVDFAAEVREMPEAQRRATFLRAIRDARQACQQVVDAKTSEPVDGNAAWGVRCEDGRGWLISIAADGNAKVTGPVASK